MKPAIVLSAHTTALGVIRALGRIGVPIVAVTYGKKDFSHCSRYVTVKVHAPHPEKNGGQFLARLVEIADRFRGGLLIPVSDETLSIVSKNKEMLEHYYIVACPEWTIIERVIDKKLTYSLAKAADVPIPKTMIAESSEDVERYSRSMDYPCLVKPRFSHLYFEHFGRKMSKVSSRDEMLAAYRDADEQGLKVMIQEYIPGDDSQVANYNSYFWDNQPLIEFTAHQIRKAPPELGPPCVVLSKHVPEVIVAGRKALRAIDFYGFSCTEFRKDPRDGIYKLLDINGRHNLSSSLAVHCGINFPLIQYAHLADGIKLSAGDQKEKIYWIDPVRDAAFISRLLFSVRNLSQIIVPYIQPHIFADLNWQDPLPFLRRLVNLAKRLYQKTTHKRRT